MSRDLEVLAPPDTPTDQPPRLADGIDLIGEFKGSGFRQPPYIARRADGQVVQMPELLYRLAEQVDGHRDVEQIADRFSHAVKRQVDVAAAHMLIDQKLRPLGIVAPEDGADSVKLRKVDPLLALKFRAAVVPDPVVRSLTTAFRPLFLPPVVIAVVIGLLGVDGWLFFVHGITQSVRQTIYDPALVLAVIAGVILGTAFHETGHATATRYGGARPGVMGVGIYMVWPAFYTDITDSYRLGRGGRLRADLGGVYFNAVFSLLAAGAYAVTSFEPLLLLVALETFAIVEQLLPLLRLDGYYILSDLTGVPDIFLRIRPVLASLIPGRPADRRVTELKRWVRAVVTVYILFIVAFLGLTVVALVINLPRILATGYDSAAVRFQAVGPAFAHGSPATGVLDVVQMVFLVLPAVGLLYTGARTARRAASGVRGWSAGHPARQRTLGLGLATAAAFAALCWWPGGQYRPVQPQERGTVQGLLPQIAALPTARPSLTVQRQRQLHGAPFVYDQDEQTDQLSGPGSGARDGDVDRRPSRAGAGRTTPRRRTHTKPTVNRGTTNGGTPSGGTTIPTTTLGTSAPTTTLGTTTPTVTSTTPATTPTGPTTTTTPTGPTTTPTPTGTTTGSTTTSTRPP